MSLTLSCEMNLGSYPHDVQDCSIKIMSLQYTADNVLLLWREFQVTDKLLLAQFDVTGRNYANCTKTYSIGTFSCLVGNIRLSRRLGYFLINKFIPSILIVTMSQITFWIPAEAYPARVTLSVTSLLTIVTQQYQTAMPSVSYVVALNIWMLSCIGFVFSTLLEYALVIAVKENQVSPLRPVFVREKVTSIYGNTNELFKRNNTMPPTGTFQQSSGKIKISYNTIDRLSRIIFPVGFVIFCTSYCFIYIPH
ncbi:glycine receptor subunit alpha-1-like [Tachypleus tridentatus]|uniref:glycine receptor subunit alpha-1-like n=1 Tax=Tachypleus tridentatus TaxID=6853 RepID=UPI003FD13955